MSTPRLLLCLPILAAASARAQVSEPAAKPANSEVVNLTPFEVEATSDNSYGALNSNSITSFNTALDRLPISADIFTRSFIDDTNSQTVEQLLTTYSAGAGLGSAGGDPSGSPVNNPLDRGGGGSVSAGVELRGLGAAVIKQDSFMNQAQTGTGLNSTFGLERVEVINGPQALLYGNGGAGGVINLISLQARLGAPAKGQLKFQVDQYGHKLGQIDYGAGSSKVAFVVSLINQNLGNYREYIGGPLQGVYTQAAFQAGSKTVIRLTEKYTDFNRFINTSPTLNAGSATIDARNGQNLHYLIATNQLAASASGPSGAGLIDYGHLNWTDVDSYGAQFRRERTKAQFSELTADTRWSDWFSTQVGVGYQSNRSGLGDGSGFVFYSPTATSNPQPGNWTIGVSGSGSALYSWQPSRSKAIRFSGLLTNDLFRGAAHSQTIFGADFVRGDYANISYGYYLADSNWNPVISATSTANAGRTLLTTLPSYTINNGPVQYPWWPAGSSRINFNGNNYVLMIQNTVNKALISPANPQGVTGTQLYLHSEALSRGYYAVNYTQWMDDKLDTLAGFRYSGAYAKQAASSAQPMLVADGNNLSFSLGADYKVTNWIRPYVTVSDSYNLPGILLTVPTDPYGSIAQVSHAVGEEAGLKLGDPKGKISGSLAFYTVRSKNEPYSIISNLVTDINPSGLNGRSGAPGTVINVDRVSSGGQITLTAAPTPSWRMRLSAGFIQGKIGTNTSYGQLYNDQFHENSQGQVTYADGTVVYVAPTFNSKTPAYTATNAPAGSVPLTVAKMSSPTDLYYANPVAVTGQITASSNAGKVLNVVDATHGAILTGVTGLPISQMQINPGFTVPGTIVTSQSGDSTTGYPTFSTNFTSMYTIPSGWIKGVKFGGTVNLAWERNDYYYYPTGFTVGANRTLFRLPTQTRFDGIIGYERKLGKLRFSTQLNVTNIFNHYHVVILPNNVSGYPGVDDATFDQLPRGYTWTNTLSF